MSNLWLVPTRASRAAHELADHLRSEGHHVTPSKVQFWADGGLFGPLRQTWPGGGGSEVLYPAEAPEVASIIVNLPRAARKRREVLLACFARGVPVELAELRTALVDVLADLREAMPAPVDSDEDAIPNAAEETAATLVNRRRPSATRRLWAKNAAGWQPPGTEAADQFRSPGERLTALISPMIAAFMGDTTLLSGAMGGLLTAVAGSEAVELATAHSGVPAGDFQEQTAKTTAGIIEGLDAAAATVEEHELRGARRVLVALERAGQAPGVEPEGPFQPLTSPGRVLAASALGLVVAARNSGSSLDQWALLVEEIVQFSRQERSTSQEGRGSESS